MKVLAIIIGFILLLLVVLAGAVIVAASQALQDEIDKQSDNPEISNDHANER